MKKLFAIFAAALLAVPAVTNASEPWDGTTKAEPAQVDGVYQVSNGAELAWISDYVNAGNRAINFVLTDDIDLNNQKFEPIGNVKKKWFQGNFDGQNHEVSGLYIEAKTSGSADDCCLGLFGGTASASQTIANVTIHGKIYVSATAKIGTQAGMVIGKSDAVGDINNCHSDGEIVIDGAIGYVGGVVGFKKAGVLRNSSFTGRIVVNGTVNKGVGGVYGTSNSTTADIYGQTLNCWYAGEMVGDGTITTYCGGISGYNCLSAGSEDLKNCYAIGSLKPVYVDGDVTSTGVIYGSMKSSMVFSRVNNYYLKDMVTEDGIHIKGTKAANGLTMEQFHSGEACYKINAGAGEMIYGQNLTDPNSIPCVVNDDNKVFKLTLMVKPEEPNKVSGPVYAEDQTEPDADPFADYVQSRVSYTNPSLIIEAAPDGHVWTDRDGVEYGSGSVVDGDLTLYAIPMQLSVEEIEAADGAVEYFNLQGVRVDNPGHGLYIRRTPAATAKVRL